MKMEDHTSAGSDGRVELQWIDEAPKKEEVMPWWWWAMVIFAVFLLVLAQVMRAMQ